MAYSYKYIYFGICTSAYDSSYIRFPSKSPIPISSGTRIGGNSATYSLVYSGGTAIYAVYRYLYSTYANYIDINNMSNAWIDTFGNNNSSMSSYTSLQYTQYKVWKFDSSISVQSNSSLRTAVTNAGDTQSTSVVVYLFHPNVINSTYDGSYANWKGASGSYDREYKYHSTSSTSSRDTINIGFLNTSTGTRIIKLCTSGYNAGQFNTLVRTASSSSAISLNTSNYKGYNLTDLTTSGTLSTSGNGVDKVYVLHNTGFTTLTLYGAVSGHCYSSGGTITEVTGRYYYGSANFDAWVSHDDMSNNNRAYFGFTGKTNSLFKQASLSVQVGYTYTFNLYTYSEAGRDGILISTSNLSSGTYNTTTGRIGRCSGINVTSSCTYTPSANGEIYLYFITDTSWRGGTSGYTYDSSGGENPVEDGYTYGDVKVTRSAATFTVTLNDLGGNNGQGTVTATYGQNLPTVTVPTRVGFEFLGYYFRPNEVPNQMGTQYINGSGNGIKSYELTSPGVTLYARWKNKIHYELLSTQTIYTTYSALAATSTMISQNVTVAANGWSCPTGSLTVSRTDSNSSWILNSTGTTLTVPSGVNYGTYNPAFNGYKVIVKLTSPASANYVMASGNYVSDEKTISIPIVVASTYVSSYGAVTVPSALQLPLPASGITLTSSNIHSYISLSNAQQTVTYNNGASRSGQIAYTFAGNLGVGNTTFSVEGRGNTYASTTRNISISTGLIVAVAVGEGGKSSTTQITSLVQDSNPVTSVAVTVASNTINYNATTSLTITATYKSTSTRTITSLSSPESGVTLSVTTNPSNIISIT